MKVFLTVVGLFLNTILLADPASVSGQELPPEAVAVLNRFLGEWETETSMRHEGPPVRKSKTRGRALCRQTLEDRYYEFRTWSVPRGYSDLQIMTYDLPSRSFRQWLFDADGYHHAALGRWDPNTTTLRWEGKKDGASFVIEDRWVSPDRLEWTLTRTGSLGQRLQSIKGVLTRPKKKP